MSIKKIKNDAENLVIKNGMIKEIGGSLLFNKLPKYQYTGIIKLTYKDFTNLKKIYFKKKDYNIDFTTFLNLAIKLKELKLKSIITNRFWFEIDNRTDVEIFKNFLNKK
jgi:choline kinase